MMTVSDYVMKFLADRAIHDIFLVSGGGIMYLLDALGRNKKLRYISTYHEQAAATAAESYARTIGKPAVCLVTTGPGSTNAITGVAGAWYDSVPMIVIAGQVRTGVLADYTKTRQKAPQEVNVTPMVSPITKYVVLVTDPSTIRYELEKAYYLATSERPGPVWLTIPLDIQSSVIDETQLSGFTPKKEIEKIDPRDIKEVRALLKHAKRPLIILGGGVRISTSEHRVEQFVNQMGIPVALVLNGMDLIPEEHPLLVGRIGPAGQRKANFVLQTADCILSIGASLNINSTGFEFAKFAPRAKKIIVNIEQGELDKIPFPVNLGIQMDAHVFIQELMKEKNNLCPSMDSRWIPTIQMWKEKYPTVLPSFYKDTHYVNGYVFVDELCKAMNDTAPVVTGMGQDVVSFQQVFRVKKGQKAFVNKNFGQMGWCLPAAIGASIARNKGHVVLITGDGSIEFNLHELQTISYYKLPITIFVFNNNGYKSIRDTQHNLFQGRLVGADQSSGVGNPDFKKLAAAFRIPYRYLKNNAALTALPEILSMNGPVLCELHINENQERIPRSGTFINAEGKLESLPLEDLQPPIPREELYEIMHFFDEQI